MEVLKLLLFVFIWLNVGSASIQVRRKSYAIATLNALAAIIIALQLFASLY